MDTRLIEYLVALQEEKSFSKAAKRLFLTPSALNQQLSRLEQELGVQLFERNGRNLVPTAAGNIYLAGARKVLDIKAQAVREMDAIQKGEQRVPVIRLALHRDFKVFFTRTVEPALLEACPCVRVEPVIVEDTSAKLEVVNERADLAFIINSGVTASSLGGIPIRKEPLHLAFPKSLLNEEADYRTLIAALDELGFIGGPLNTLEYAERYYLNRTGLKPEILCRATSFRHLRYLLNRQFAYALLPASAILEEDSFAHVPILPSAAYILEIVYNRRFPMTPAVRELLMLLLRLFDSDHGGKTMMDAFEE